MRQCAIVLGMRSGTSAVMGVLKALGVNTGYGHLPVSRDNPKGFFEIGEIVKYNAQIVDWKKIHTAQVKALRINEIQVLLKAYFFQEPVFAVKDPRIAGLIECYDKAIRGLAVMPKYVLCKRDVIEVARSLKTAGHIVDFRTALNTAIAYREFVEKMLEGKDLICVQFADLIRNPIEEAHKLAKFLKLKPTKKQLEEVVEFVDESLYRERGPK